MEFVFKFAGRFFATMNTQELQTVETKFIFDRLVAGFSRERLENRELETRIREIWAKNEGESWHVLS